MYKNLFLVLLIIFLFGSNCLAYEKINAKNNAYIHNNKGLIYLQEKYYFGAIKEFQIAINLNPKSQASATYYTNLGTTYEKIGYPNLAMPCFEKALSLNPLNFSNYLTLAKNYKTLGIAEKKLKDFDSKKDFPLNSVMVGLLYIQTGQTSIGITVLDEFINKEENILITTGVKNYVKELTKANFP